MLLTFLCTLNIIIVWNLIIWPTLNLQELLTKFRIVAKNVIYLQ